MKRLHQYGDLAEILRRQRKAQGVPQEEMAAYLSVAHTTLARLEKESGTKTLRLLFAALDSLGIVLYAQEPGFLSEAGSDVSSAEAGND